MSKFFFVCLLDFKNAVLCCLDICSSLVKQLPKDLAVALSVPEAKC